MIILRNTINDIDIDKAVNLFLQNYEDYGFEAIENPESNTTNIWNFEEILKTFIEECDDYGVTVKKGTGRITKDGKDFDIAKAVEEAFRRKSD